MVAIEDTRRKHALVTGVGGGIAPAVVRALKAEGILVTGTDIREQIDREAAPVDEFRSGDISDASFCKSIVAQNGTGVPFDVLVNCAAIPQEGAELHELTPEQWEQSLGVNLDGAWNLSWALVPDMIEHGGGAIVYLASTSAMKPRVGSGAYSVAKAAVRALSRAQALELAKRGISVNTVIPGATRTPQYGKNWGYESAEEAFANRVTPIPSGRLVEPEQIADAVMFFVRQPAASVTGSELKLDGGYTI